MAFETVDEACLLWQVLSGCFSIYTKAAFQSAWQPLLIGLTLI